MTRNMPGYDRHQPTRTRNGNRCAHDEQPWPCDVATAYQAGRTAALTEIGHQMGGGRLRTERRYWHRGSGELRRQLRADEQHDMSEWEVVGRTVWIGPWQPVGRDDR
jgi:hypothetical protein